MNQLTEHLIVAWKWDGAHRASNGVRATPTVTRYCGGILLFVLMLGIAQCKPRETNGYCQMPCEKVCPIEGGGEVCVATNDPQYGCASNTTCAKCKFENATATCDNEGACTLGGCTPDYADCDGDVGNGCETRYTTDTKNCGACGTACPGGETHALFKCVSGLCDIDRCIDGYKDCNNRYVDGCETTPNDECVDSATSTQGN